MIGIILEKMIQYFGNDIPRINHALKVYGFAHSIADTQKLSESEVFIVDVAAIFHDIGIVQAEKIHKSTAGKYQEIEGPGVARQLLSDVEITPHVLDRICFIIGNHHSYDAINGIDFQIIVEADFLVNMFEETCSQEAIETIRTKYFKTSAGIRLLDTMYQGSSQASKKHQHFT